MANHATVATVTVTQQQSNDKGIVTYCVGKTRLVKIFDFKSEQLAQSSLLKSNKWDTKARVMMNMHSENTSGCQRYVQA